MPKPAAYECDEQRRSINARSNTKDDLFISTFHEEAMGNEDRIMIMGNEVNNEDRKKADATRCKRVC